MELRINKIKTNDLYGRKEKKKKEKKGARCHECIINALVFLSLFKKKADEK